MVDRRKIDLVAPLGQVFARLDDGGMLDHRRHDPGALRTFVDHLACNGKNGIVRFGATAGEYDFIVIGTDEDRTLMAGLGQQAGGITAEGMHA